MKILALDPAAKTGWAFSNGGPHVASGVAQFKAKQFGARCKEYRQWLVDMVKEHDVDLVGIETMYKGVNSNETTEKWLRALNIIAHEVCATRNIEIEEVAINAWRSVFVGVTHAPKWVGADLPKQKRQYEARKWIKKRVIEECQSRGWSPKDDNEADALGILEFVRRKHDHDYAVRTAPLFARHKEAAE